MHFFDAAGEATWIIVNPSTGAQVHHCVTAHFLSLLHRQALEQSGSHRRWLSQPTLVWRPFTVVLVITAPQFFGHIDQVRTAVLQQPPSRHFYHETALLGGSLQKHGLSMQRKT